MMTVAQKVPFELVPLDGPASGFTDSFEVAAALAGAIDKIPNLDRSRLLLFGGCASASRDAGVTMQMVGERLGILDQFLAVDELKVEENGSLRFLERIEGGRYQVSVCSGPPAMVAWATGNLPELQQPADLHAEHAPIMPACRKPAAPCHIRHHLRQRYLPDQQRQTRIVKDLGGRDRQGDRGLDQGITAASTTPGDDQWRRFSF